MIAGFVRKMSGTSEVDTDTMNRAVSKMVEEALKYNQVESVLESGEEEDIFSPEYFEKLSDVKMPATKLELLIKMLRKQIKEYGKVNQLAAKSFQEMLEKTIAEYHERRKHLTAEEAGEAQEKASEDIIKIATEQALAILRQMNENRESFRKIGLTFEEEAFYDILILLRDQYNFVYGTDKEVDGVVVNDKCKALAKKIKDIIDVNDIQGDNRIDTQDGAQGGIQDGTQDGTQGGTQGGTQDKLQEQIFDMIKDNPQISTSEMATKLGVGVRTVKRRIKQMTNIVYVGSGYSGHWEIK